MDYLDIDCLHDVDHLMDTSHAISSTCLDMPPIYDEYDDEHVELQVVMLCSIGYLVKILFVTSCLTIH